MNSSKAVRLLKSLRGDQRILHRFAWSPSGEHIAVPGDDAQIRVWGMPSGELVQVIASDSPQITNVAWSPDGSILAYASSDVHLYDWSQRRVVAVIREHQHSVWSMAWSPDGKLLASGSYDRSVRIWQVSTRNLLQEFRGHGACQAL
jgi:WD40 repeat protein